MELICHADGDQCLPMVSNAVLIYLYFIQRLLEKVISYYSESIFQDGHIAQAASDVANKHEIQRFTAADNEKNKDWHGEFKSTKCIEKSSQPFVSFVRLSCSFILLFVGLFVRSFLFLDNLKGSSLSISTPASS